MLRTIWGLIKDPVLKPLLRRVGTAAAVFLMTGGDWLCAHWSACGLVTENGLNTVGAYVMAVCLLAVELLVSWGDKLAAQRKAVNKALS